MYLYFIIRLIYSKYLKKSFISQLKLRKNEFSITYSILNEYTSTEVFTSQRS